MIDFDNEEHKRRKPNTVRTRKKRNQRDYSQTTVNVTYTHLTQEAKKKSYTSKKSTYIVCTDSSVGVWDYGGREGIYNMKFKEEKKQIDLTIQIRRQIH